MRHRRVIAPIVGAALCLGAAMYAPGVEAPATRPGGASSPRAAATAATRPAFQPELLKPVALLGDPRFRHADNITAINVIDGGRQIATSSRDGAVRLWDAATGRELRRFTMPKGESAWSMQVLPDGKRLVSCGGDDQVTLWDLETGAAIRRMKHEGTVLRLAVLPGGHQVIAVDYEKAVVQWDLESGDAVHRFTGHTERVYGAAISPDAKTLVTCSEDKSIRIWDLSRGQGSCTHTLTKHHTPVTTVAFAPARRVGIPGVPSIPLSPTTHATTQASQPSGGTESGGGGPRFLGVCEDHTVRLWDLRGNDKELWSASLGGDAKVAAFSPDGQTIAVPCDDGHLYLLNAGDGKERERLDLPHCECWPVTYSADGTRLYCDVHGVLFCWDMPSGKRRFPPESAVGSCPLGAYAHIALHPDTLRLYSAADDDSAVCVWDLKRGVVETTWDTGGKIGSLDLSPDHKRLLVGLKDHKALILDAATGKTLHEINPGNGNSEAWWRWAEGGRSIVTEADRNTLEVWETNGNNKRTISMGQENWRPPQAVNGNGTLVFKQGQNGAFGIWNLSSGACIASLSAGADDIDTAAFLREADGFVVIDGKHHMTYWPAPERPPAAAPSAADLARWVSDLGSEDYATRETATARLTQAGDAAAAALGKADMSDPEVGERINRIRAGASQAQLPDHPVGEALELSGHAYSLAMHPDGRHWAARVNDGAAAQIILGELTPQGPKLLRTLSDLNCPHTVQFGPDGATLYVGNGNTTISVYR